MVNGVDGHRVLVTGSQEWRDVDTIYRALNLIRNRPLTVVHGGARGADRIAGQWARDQGQANGVYEEPHPVREDQYRFSGRKLAPLLRNTFMVDLGAHLCLAFHLDDSEGTADCIRKAVDKEIPTQVYERTTLPQPAAGLVVPLAR